MRYLKNFQFSTDLTISLQIIDVQIGIQVQVQKYISPIVYIFVNLRQAQHATFTKNHAIASLLATVGSYKAVQCSQELSFVLSKWALLFIRLVKNDLLTYK